MAFNSILRELGNGVDGSYFVDGVAIYITIRNLRVATRALQGVTNKLDSWENTSKTVNIILEREWETNKNHTKKPYKESTKILGLTLDNRINWGENINKLRALNTI